eukprot:5440946-Pleurochrysis_carterae.AAC.1
MACAPRSSTSAAPITPSASGDLRSAVTHILPACAMRSSAAPAAPASPSSGTLASAAAAAARAACTASACP